MTKKVFKTNQIITAVVSIVAGLFFAYLFRREIFHLFQSSSEKSMYYIFLVWPALFVLGGIMGILAFVSDKAVLSILQVASNILLALYWVDRAGLDDRYWALGRILFSGALAVETLFFLVGYDLTVRSKKKALDEEKG
jgi:hypothetical protein